MRTETKTLTITTPEGISFDLVLAGPATRFFAWALDMMCVSAAMLAIAPIVSVLGLISADFTQAFLWLLYFVGSIGYAMAAEWFWRGQTLGKRLLHLRVLDENGLHLHPSQIIIRNLLRFVDMFPALYLLGGLVSFFSKRAQRLGDFAANTVVIRERDTLTYDIQQVASGKFNSFRDYPHIEYRLRQKTSPKEAAVALQALLRRDQFEPQARIELFHDVANHFRQIAPFPEEASLGLTDEQYTRNVVDTLFRQK